MSFKDPKAVAKAGVEKGSEKARLSWDKALVAGFLAGAYIAFGAMVAIVSSAGLDPERWGNLQTFVAGTVFCLGLILVIVAARSC
jgi:formate/nitrite transporter FocA (FNT family)